MKLLKFFIGSLIIILVTCTTGISYRPAVDDTDLGYKDESLEDGKYWVGFLGGFSNSLQEVDAYWNRRATELCTGRDYEVEGYTNARITREGQFTNGSATPSSLLVTLRANFPYSTGIIQCR